MNLVAEERSRSTTAYTRLNESPFAPADAISIFAASSGTDSVQKAWDGLIDELIRIRFLKEDWDGDGSVAPDPDAVSGATKLALTLRTQRAVPADRVTASVNGTVVFEWHLAEGYQEIEVTSPIDAELRWIAKGARTALVRALVIS